MPINWQDVVTNIGTTAVSATVVVGAVAWVIKTAVSHRLSRQAEEFKNSLQMMALEHQVRFSKLHEKRAEVIAGVYERLVDVEKEGGRFVLVEGFDNGTERQQEAWDKIRAAMLDVSLFIEKHRIYLPERICALLKTFLDIMSKNLTGVGVYSSIKSPIAKTQADKQEVLAKAYEAFQSDIPAAKRALEDEFRKMLGVEDSAPSVHST
jgi:hypothetical protein